MPLRLFAQVGNHLWKLQKMFSPYLGQYGLLPAVGLGVKGLT